MIKEICGEEMTLILDIASRYMLDMPRRSERVNHKWKPYERIADQKLRAYLRIIDEILETTFGSEPQDYKITRINHTQAMIFRLEIEISNYSRPVEFLGEKFYPMLFFSFETINMGLGHISIGFNSCDQTGGILIPSLWSSSIKCEPHELPDDWGPEKYAIVADQFLTHLHKLHTTECTWEEIEVLSCIDINLYFSKNLSAFERTVQKYGLNYYAFIRGLMCHFEELGRVNTFRNFMSGFETYMHCPFMERYLFTGILVQGYGT